MAMEVLLLLGALLLVALCCCMRCGALGTVVRWALWCAGHCGALGTAVASAKPGELSGAGDLGQQEVRQMALETRIWSM